MFLRHAWRHDVMHDVNRCHTCFYVMNDIMKSCITSNDVTYVFTLCMASCKASNDVKHVFKHDVIHDVKWCHTCFYVMNDITKSYITSKDITYVLTSRMTSWHHAWRQMTSNMFLRQAWRHDIMHDDKWCQTCFRSCMMSWRHEWRQMTSCMFLLHAWRNDVMNDDKKCHACFYVTHDFMHDIKICVTSLNIMHDIMTSCMT